MARPSRVATIPEMTTVLAALIDLNHRAHYVHSGWFLISVANLIVIALMVAAFVVAIVAPFPGSKR